MSSLKISTFEYGSFNLSEKQILLYFIEKGLIFDYLWCTMCGCWCEIRYYKMINTIKEPYFFKCVQCQTVKSIYMNIIFEKMRISLKTYYILIEAFLINLKAKETEEVHYLHINSPQYQ
jgi:hypothetical protein